MIKSFIEPIFLNIDPVAVVIVIAVLFLCLIKFLSTHWKDIREFINNQYQRKRSTELTLKKIEDTAAATESNAQSIQELTVMFKEFVQAQEKYRDQSRELRNNIRNDNLESLEKSSQALGSISEINASIESIREHLDTLSEDTKDMRRQTNAQKLNELRDRLLQGYRYYTSNKRPNPGAWTRMEAESYWALFGDYEDLGGDGYMHTIVQPEMNKLSIIEI